MHWSSSADASLSRQLCALRIFVCVMWVAMQKTIIGRCRPIQNNRKLNAPLLLLGIIVQVVISVAFYAVT